MSMICPIHKTHFGRGFAGRGRRRCYECERNQTMGNTFEIHSWLPYGEGKYGYLIIGETQLKESESWVG